MRFEVIAEIEPPVGADLVRVHEQVAALRAVATRFLVPDNHTGRATVSSLVVADRVQAAGARTIACLNARDRNLLGVRRDLLTARHLGVEELLLVYGDDPSVGDRADGMRVRTMFDECDAASIRCSVTSRLGPVPKWKQRAAGVFVQVCWSLDELLRWRDGLDLVGEVIVGVMVMPSAQTARRIGERIPELRPPASLLDALDRDRDAGVRCAAEMVAAVRASGAFDGVHLVGGSRFRDIAAALIETPGFRVPAGLTMETAE